MPTNRSIGRLVSRLSPLSSADYMQNACKQFHFVENMHRPKPQPNVAADFDSETDWESGICIVVVRISFAHYIQFFMLLNCCCCCFSMDSIT